MDIVIKSLGIVVALIGIVYLLRPGVMKWLMEFFKQGKRIYFAGLIKSIIDWWQKQSLLLLRAIALIALAVGAIIIYSA